MRLLKRKREFDHGTSKRRRLPLAGDIHGLPEIFTGLLDGGRFEHRGLQLAKLSGRPKLRGEDLHNHLFDRDGISRAVQTLHAMDGRFVLASAPARTERRYGERSWQA